MPRGLDEPLYRVGQVTCAKVISASACREVSRHPYGSMQTVRLKNVRCSDRSCHVSYVILTQGHEPQSRHLARSIRPVTFNKEIRHANLDMISINK